MLRQCMAVAGLRVWRRLGAPAPVVDVLERFYGGQRKWVEGKGAVAAAPISCARSLLQGCPASCLLLAAMMATWVEQVKAAAGPSLEVGVFVDDRTLWSTAAAGAAAATLTRALDRADLVDAAMGFVLHPDKGELFARTRGGRAALQALAPRVGPVAHSFKLLGVVYNTTKAIRRPVDPKWDRKVNARLRRIGKAVRSRHAKAKMIRKLVLPIFTHVGAWTRPTASKIQKWQNSIERTVLGRIVPGRSRFLVWAAMLGCRLDPDFVLDSEALRHEVWRSRRSVGNGQGSAQRSTGGRMSEVAEKWGWRRSGAGQYETPDGVLEVGWDGAAVLQAAAKRGWERHLWEKEPRAQDNRTQALRNVARPCCDSQRALLQGDSALHGERMEVALAAGRDARALSRIYATQVVCSCGEENPDRRHVTWRCTSRPQDMAARVRAPTCGAEEGLLVPMVPRGPRGPVWAGRTHHADLAEALRRQWQRKGRPPLVATDGGSEGSNFDTRVAGWGAHTDGPELERATASGSVPGLDQTAYAAELWALVELLRAATAARVGSIIVIIDNKSVANRAAAIARGAVAGAVNCPEAWAHVASMLANLPGSEIHWVPAHGRHPEWSPPEGHNAVEWRALNDTVDHAASAVSKRRWGQSLPERTAVDGAKLWAHHAMRLQLQQLQLLERGLRELEQQRLQRLELIHPDL